MGGWLTWGSRRELHGAMSGELPAISQLDDAPANVQAAGRPLMRLIEQHPIVHLLLRMGMGGSGLQGPLLGDVPAITQREAEHAAAEAAGGRTLREVEDHMYTSFCELCVPLTVRSCR